MKALFTFLLFTSFAVFADAVTSTPFNIPRSTVVDINDPATNLIYPLFIKTPASYNKQVEKQYPVIYLTDAYYEFQIVSGATRYPMNIAVMEEAIIVGISYAKGSKGSSSRNRDYTPTFNKKWKDKTGEAKQHAEFIEKSVFDYIDTKYRTDPTNRTFIGNSLGGLFGTYILLNKPSMFKNYILGSPSYWWDNEYIFTQELEFAKQNVAINANVFIAIGELETIEFGAGYNMVGDAKEFYKRMLNWQSDNLNVKLMIIPQADHATAFPTTAIQGLKWVLGKCDKANNCLLSPKTSNNK
ncbi:alpha/beta hydrolase-fold protein [Colwellia sp. 4_MG-2023]|uniref:alpha/beta hydrolase n=1 Tax=unclassified Colwellia TaxID=196834 RepID=UPI0026E26864|nr:MULTISPECIES: alpha/beta hydrolase-fold protein [unclassified Colwellia]MDO6507746.1 alpha/beta hydrolase-fold protein [Colwellia sp. 5_MG-2023]MDO6556348.1 alpha/beta hydrolase-fold protein [Colwellia sp. 4_MG-2023]